MNISGRNTWLHLYAKLVAFATFVLIVAGGSVTSTGSGLAVPDWPLSYGQWMPPMVGGVFYEHLHRMIAAAVGLLTLILTIWVGFSEKRTWVRWLTIAALGAVVIQGILGGLTVKYLLPTPISVSHACLAQTFFALLIAISYFTSAEWKASANALSVTEDFKKLVVMTVVLVYLQLILGAWLRHSGNSIVLISHIIGALFVLVHALVVAGLAAKDYAAEKRVLLPAILIGVTSILQLSLGVGSFVFKFMMPETVMPRTSQVWFVTGHQSLGALLLGVGVFLILRIHRNTKHS